MPLRIETGRFENIKDSLTGRFRKLKVEERKCQICNLDDIEDEKHFLCICQVYDGERYLMYEKVVEKNCDFVNLSTEMKFKYLVTHEYKLVGAFISNCWNMRTQILYSTQCKL